MSDKAKLALLVVALIALLIYVNRDNKSHHDAPPQGTECQEFGPYEVGAGC